MLLRCLALTAQKTVVVNRCRDINFQLFSSHLSGKICQFPFIFDGNTYTSCTRAGNATRPWCSTKVDQFNNHISSENKIEWLTFIDG